MTASQISPRSISASDLTTLLVSTNPPLVLDVRRRIRLEESDWMLPTAQWRDPEQAGIWAKYTPFDRPIVVYCVHGHEIGQGVAGLLNDLGADVRYLEEGIEGWQEAGQRLVRRDDKGTGQTYVTRARPKIDRIACPWLITRFVDSKANFEYVPADQVLAMAATKSWQPLDVPHVELSHVGEFCSFDACIAKWRLDDPALLRLAPIVRGADTACPDLSPQAPGLLAISLGLSCLYADDQEMLRAGFTLYDALYAWSREANEEQHNWTGKI